MRLHPAIANHPNSIHRAGSSPSRRIQHSGVVEAGVERVGPSPTNSGLPASLEQPVAFATTFPALLAAVRSSENFTNSNLPPRAEPGIVNGRKRKFGPPEHAATVTSTTTEPPQSSGERTKGWGLAAKYPHSYELPYHHSFKYESLVKPTDEAALHTRLDPARIGFPPTRSSSSRDIFNNTGALVANMLSALDDNGNPIITSLMGPAEDATLIYGGFARQCGYKGEIIAHSVNPAVSNMQEKILDSPDDVIEAISNIIGDIIKEAEDCDIALDPVLAFSCDDATSKLFLERLDKVFCDPIRAIFTKRQCVAGPLSYMRNLSPKEALDGAAYTYLVHAHQGLKHNEIAPFGLALDRLKERLARPTTGQREVTPRRRVFINNAFHSTIGTRLKHLANHFMGEVASDQAPTMKSKMLVSCGHKYEKVLAAGAGTLAILDGPHPESSTHAIAAFNKQIAPVLNTARSNGVRVILVCLNGSASLRMGMETFGLKGINDDEGGRLAIRGRPFRSLVFVNFDVAHKSFPVLHNQGDVRSTPPNTDSVPDTSQSKPARQ